MALHPDHDSADENDGKYSTDEKMTFEGVLKASLREQAEHRNQLDELVEKDRGPTQPEREAANRRIERREAAERQREEKASREREALATMIGEAHSSDKPSLRIATGETDRIGQDTTYEFARTKVNHQTYYYVVQNTDRCYERHDGSLVVKDFGTEWSYDVPEIDADALRAAVARQRQDDFRADREPVDWFTDDQYESIGEWYRNRVKSELLTLEDVPRRKEGTVHVLDHYLVVDADEATLGLGRYLSELSDRQADVVSDALLRLVEADTDFPTAVYEHIRDSVDYPLLAQITFSSE